MDVKQRNKLTPKAITQFQKTIYDYYKKHGRVLPWRETHDPYKILVSEVMLQQTQVQRVLPKYDLFIKVFPNLHALAKAPFPKILALWHGLGYNRRALYLKRLAEIAGKDFNNRLPSDYDALVRLPGVGKTTAAGICIFAFNKIAIYFETNIRSVFIHFFFKNKKKVHDREILPLLEETIHKDNPREWYYALMDYGSMLKATRENPSRRSAHHAKQSAFHGSDRELRGKIIKNLLEHNGQSMRELQKKLNDRRLLDIVNNLVEEGLIRKKRAGYFIA